MPVRVAVLLQPVAGAATVRGEAAVAPTYCEFATDAYGRTVTKAA